MKNNYLTKVVTLATVTVSIIALNPIGASATNSISIDQAKSIIINNGNIYGDTVGNNFPFNKGNITFDKEISPAQSSEYTVQNIDTIIDNQENLYTCFYYGVRYFVGINSGNLYEYDGGTGIGSFSYLQNNKKVKSWYWERERVNNGWNYDTGWKQNQGWQNFDGNWYCYKDGVMKTGWICDSGNWYYCYSNGQMASNTTIDGYYLGSSGAWTN